MSVKKVIVGSSVKSVVISSATIRSERESVFSLEDSEFQMISPTRARLYHPAGVPVGMIDPRLVLDECYESRAIVFICTEELRAILEYACKSPNLAGCRVNARRF